MKRTEPAKVVPRANGSRYVVASLFGAALVASGMLVAEHLGGLSLPGCGEGGGCAAATRSVWGRVPGVGWPVSHVGAAFFGAMVVAVFRGGLREVRGVARVGAAVSLCYLGVIFAEQLLCFYCIATHIANLLACVIVEWATRRDSSVGRPATALIGACFAIFTGLLAAAEWNAQRVAAARAELELAESTQKLIAAASQPASSATTRNGAATRTTTSAATTMTAPPTPTASRPVFTGRYRLGPERAAIRVVVFSDYQCQACRQIEGELRALQRERGDLSISAKQFPVATGCNPHITRTMHVNACWAARAAEAAGLLRGNDGFWEMHFKLFDRGGSFTQAELRAMVTEMGYDAAQFEATMTGPETLRRVRADCDEAMELGMRQTPMIFINGVEFRGWEAPNALRRAVDALAATNPPSATAAADRPAGAIEKLVEDWRQQPIRTIPQVGRGYGLGPDNAPVQVVIAMDYTVPGVAPLDESVRAAVARRGDVRYTIVHYPANADCNPGIPATIRNEKACWAARAVEAAGRAGGEEAFWRVHAWLLANQGCFTDAELLSAAPELGVDAALLREALGDASLGSVVRADAMSLRTLNIGAIPTLYINGRVATSWDHRGRLIVEELLDAAAKGAGERP